nr:uncharacterized protein LOC123762239 [Procambarus clarkii]
MTCRSNLLEEGEPRENLWVRTPSKQRLKPRLGRATTEPKGQLSPGKSPSELGPGATTESGKRGTGTPTSTSPAERHRLCGLPVGEGRHIEGKGMRPRRREEVHLGASERLAKPMEGVGVDHPFHGKGNKTRQAVHQDVEHSLRDTAGPQRPA